VNEGPSPLPIRPYPGLRPYGYKDRAVFFGRADQSFALYRMVDLNGFLAVVGSSGSGKSSLVLAGLLPLLESERDQGGRQWRWEIMHPGDDPVAALADLLTGLSNDADLALRSERRGRIDYQLRRSSFGIGDSLREVDGFDNCTLLIVVDQFEEVFRLFDPSPTQTPLESARRRDEATRFVQILLEANRDPKVDLRIVITMRSDFIGDCARFHGLPEIVSKRQYLVPALTRDQREEAIVKPLQAFGAAIDTELVERLHNDCLDDMDQLPVLQHALSRMWDAAGERQKVSEGGDTSRRLTSADYDLIGKLSGALSQHADDILRALPEADVEYVFRALSATDGEGRIVRRSLALSQLAAETGIAPEPLQDILRPFRADDCSFLLPTLSEAETLTSEARVSVGHEALLRGWERVSGDPTEAGAKPGWRHAEEEDARKYRFLVFMVDSGAQTLPPDLIEKDARWWRERRRTSAWADRYGGRREEVEALILRSEEALAAQRRKDLEDVDKEKASRRRVMTASALLVAAILLGGSSLILQHRKTEQAEEVANQSLASVAQSATTYIGNVSNLYGQGDITAPGAKTLLDVARLTVSKLDHVRLSVDGRKAKLNYLFAVTDFSFTMDDQTNATKFASEAVDLARPLITLTPQDSNAHRLLAAAALRSGEAGRVWVHLPDYDPRIPKAFMLARSEAEEATRLAPDDTNAIDQLVDVYTQYGDWEQKLGQVQAAKDMYKRSLDTLLALVRKVPDSLPLQGKLASIMERVGDFDLPNDASPDGGANLADAKTYLTGAFEIRNKLVTAEPDNTTYLSNLAVSYSDLAALAWLNGDWRTALSHRHKYVVMQESLVAKDPKGVRWQSYLEKSLQVEIEDLKRSLTKPDISDAERSDTLQLVKRDYNRIIEVRSDLATLEPVDLTRRPAIAESFEVFADFLAANKMNTLAEDNYNKAIDVWTSVGAQHQDCRECAEKITSLSGRLTKMQTAQP
jgi:tetratricopeptide (TPR) repeat protein